MWSGFLREKSDFMCLVQWCDCGKTDTSQQYTLNAMQDTCRLVKGLETEIVELEAIGSSTGEQGHIEVLRP